MRMSEFTGCRVPDPPEYDECLGYWENPDHFDVINCKGCDNYDECWQAREEDEEGTISRDAVLRLVAREYTEWDDLYIDIAKLPSVTPSRPKGHCKECKYFELDHWAEINGVPAICAHEICTKWCSGVKTSSDGYCHLFEEME